MTRRNLLVAVALAALPITATAQPVKTGRFSTSASGGKSAATTCRSGTSIASAAGPKQYLLPAGPIMRWAVAGGR